MDEQGAKAEIEKLRAEIARHEELYRVHYAPEISDEDYDALMHRLRALEARFPQFVTPDSPSMRVGDDRTEGFESVRHLSPMLSLDNVFDTAELADFDARLKKLVGAESDLRYCVEPKIDGAGISAVYENGRLARLLTRGNGEKGDDITRNAFVISNLPTTLRGKDFPALLEIRGEAYMEKSEFERLKEAARAELQKKALEKKRKEAAKDGIDPGSVALDAEDLAAVEKKLPANPRNLAAGTMKLLDASVLRSRELKAILYSIGACDGFELKRQSDLPRILESWGLPAVNWCADAVGADAVFGRISELEEIRADFPFNTDGAVVKLDDCSLHEKAGLTSHAPRWAIAWKYRAERAQTRLNAITIQVGRTGALTPVAELEPIENLSGTEVRRATLHNESYIADKDIRVGDTVVVEKAGEIIPAVLGIVSDLRPDGAKPYEFPTVCPECGSAVKKYGEITRCPNMACPPQIRGRLEHFASRGCMDIRGLGEKNVGELVEKLGVRDPADLYSLTRERLLSTGKFKDKSADNLIESIEKSKSRELWRLIFGLGILEIGEQFAKDIAAKFGTLDALMDAGIADIMSLEGFGSKAAKNAVSVRALSVRAFFDNPNNRALVERLREAGLNFSAGEAAQGNSPLSGKTFVFTGSLKSMGRDAAKALVEKLGGKTASSVGAKTDFLVSDGEMNGSKAKAAEKFGTKILSEGEFLKMLESSEPAQNQEAGAAESEEKKAPRPAPAEGGGQMTFGF